MFICLLKANIALALFFLVYHLGLRRLTFYTLNRYFLLASIFFAAIFPFLNPTVLVRKYQSLNAVANNYAPDLKLLGSTPATALFVQLLAVIFWTGVMVMGLRLSIRLLSMWKLHRSTNPANIKGSQVRVSEKQIAPFSFLQNIYLNPSLHNCIDLEAILRHEQVHVKEWHTVDILLGEINKVFYWFNPGAWLMSIAIRENLEFIADRHILRQGIDPKTYQYSLLQVSGLSYCSDLAPNFNFSHLKSRIVMMNKERSSSANLLRYIALGSLVAVMLLSLNFTHAVVGKRHAVAVAKPVLVKKDPAQKTSLTQKVVLAQNQKQKAKKARKIINIATPAATGSSTAAANPASPANPVASVQSHLPEWMPTDPHAGAQSTMTAAISMQPGVTRIMIIPGYPQSIQNLQKHLVTINPDTAALAAQKTQAQPVLTARANSTGCSCGVKMPAYLNNEEQRKNVSSMLSRINNADDILDGIVVTINGRKLTHDEKLNIHLVEANVTGRIVLSREQAQEKYGAEARTGAIEITMINQWDTP